ncbi:TetR/AcrR family transcriptional regulator [Virgisporangium ochraceum]|uniref:TetR family transcriptional regulator n=1 Tax=Virgisporangium ochraceum TaxID=65505 RepID=A0A8J3ZXP2_9ACTN|nr:TetR/AcrR family transcriptional regulator [Virgisporangium ochraceum]GIJ72244.1 TetR family transcriptional regulator [Virgisporangium ochraceum]
MADVVKRVKKPDTPPGGSRAERARATRRRIVAAAAELFVTRGYGATLLDDVAERAGVAVQTVYFHFTNKRTLLKHVMDTAAVGDDEPVPVMERPWAVQIQREVDPRRIIDLWVAGGRDILERIAPLMRVMRGATGTDPELAAQWATNQDQTRAAHTMLVRLLADRGALRPDLDLERARDIAFVVSNVETYLQFTDVCGWTPDEWREHTVGILAGALLADG